MSGCVVESLFRAMTRLEDPACVRGVAIGSQDWTQQIPSALIVRGFLGGTMVNSKHPPVRFQVSFPTQHATSLVFQPLSVFDSETTINNLQRLSIFVFVCLECFRQEKVCSQLTVVAIIERTCNTHFHRDGELE